MAGKLFAKLDLDYADHPKIERLSDAAFRAHVSMILYARKYLTDGKIPARYANRFGSETLSELLTNDEATPSLVRVESGEYELHGFLDLQESRAKVAERSQINAENGKKGGRPPKTRSVYESVSETKAETEEETDTSSSTKKRGAAKRGTRIPEPFILTHEMREWAAVEVPTVDADASTRRFVDYWRAESGTKATKLDWIATWRNWLRRDADSKKPNRLTPTERAQQTAAAGRQVAGRQVTSLDPKEITP